LKLTLAIVLSFAPAFAFPQADTADRAWPSPPDRPRIRFIQSISSIEHLHPQKGFFEHLLGLFAGGERTPQWLVQPVGIAVSAGGDLVIADPGAHGIHILKMRDQEYDFIAETEFGKYPSPVGVAFAGDGTLYVSDSQRGDVTVFDDDYDAKEIIKDSLERPTGLYVWGESLYVADAQLHAIVVFNRRGGFAGKFGVRGTGPGEFNYPVQLAGRDSLLVLDALNYRVEKFDRGGTFGAVFGKHGNVAGRFASPKGIALDSDGNIYVTDALMDNMQIFSGSGQLELIVGRNGRGNGEFLSPSGIAIDGQDRIYVVEMLNPRIQIFQYLK
jgi:DNA-binding beta-propeller fold protein YncE